jgi:hypothetical protein
MKLNQANHNYLVALANFASSQNFTRTGWAHFSCLSYESVVTGKNCVIIHNIF